MFLFAQTFAASYLQIPPRGGHPCHKLTLPTIKARSGLPRVYARAGRTQKTPLSIKHKGVL